MVQLVRHPQTKERDTDRLHLNHRATSRLYPILEPPFSRCSYRTSTRATDELDLSPPLPLPRQIRFHRRVAVDFELEVNLQPLAAAEDVVSQFDQGRGQIAVLLGQDV